MYSLFVSATVYLSVTHCESETYVYLNIIQNNAKRLTAIYLNLGKILNRVIFEITWFFYPYLSSNNCLFFT